MAVTVVLTPVLQKKHTHTENVDFTNRLEAATEELSLVNQDLTSNSKRFYSYVKCKRQETTGISPLLNQDGFLQSRSTNKAEILNQQFQPVYTKENLNNVPDMGHSMFQSMEPIIISTPGVIKLIKNLKPHKASGPDNIPTRLLIMVAEEIAPMLTTIFQTSLDTETVPSDWREALITPLYKKGLTSVESKMLEHIIFSSSMKHLNSYKILTPSQHGFRSKCSCET